MREITEAQAQELANLTGHIVFQGRCGLACLVPNNFILVRESNGMIITADNHHKAAVLHAHIKTHRAWNEQIWRPE